MSEYGQNCFLIDWFSSSCVLDAGTDWTDMLPILGLENTRRRKPVDQKTILSVLTHF